MAGEFITAYSDVINTRTKSKASIMEDSARYAKQLSPLIGGIGGRISPPTGFGCAEGVTVQEQGTVSNVMPFRGTDLAEQVSEYDLFLREACFVNRLSTGAAGMWRKIRAYSPDVLSDVHARWSGRNGEDGVRYLVLYSTFYESTLYSMFRDYLKRGLIVRSDASYIKMVMLEAMHLYMELSKLKNGTRFTSDLTSLDMSQILQNIEGVIQYFTYRTNSRVGMDRMDIIDQLRQIEKATIKAKTDVIDYL